MSVIGIVSDTHGQLVAYLFEFFAGVDHILHAGDIGGETIVTELETIAPVTAVRGNTDHGLPERFALEENVSVSGVPFYITHILDTPDHPSPDIVRGMGRNAARVAIFGHTHRPYLRIHDEVLFLNPGAAGPRRFDLPRTACRLNISDDGRLEPHYHNLEAHTPYPLPS